MSLSLALPLLLTLSGAPGPASFPKDVPTAGLVELTRGGELVLLPRHNASPFSAFIITGASSKCAAVEQAMLDVEDYPKRWPGIKEVRVQKRTPTRVEYEFDMDFIFSPTIKGKVDHPRAGTVIFHDVETGGRATWTLRDTPSGCHASYHLYQPPGKQSGFVGLITAVESGAGDSGELAGAMASARGYMKPELAHKRKGPLSPTAQATWDRLASEGTVLRMVRTSGQHAVVVAKRRTDRKVSAVLWSIRDRRRYAEKVDIVRKVKDHGRKADWGFGYFGGRVNLTTTFTEAGSPQSPEGLTITERVVGGDLPKGEWRWNIREVPGGTEVELTVDLDITQGSLVLRSLAEQDPMIRDGGALQLALAMMASIVGGQVLPLDEGNPVASK